MGPPRYGHPELVEPLPHGRGSEAELNIDGKAFGKLAPVVCAVEFYGQAERAISSSKLNPLLDLHICPIKLVVFQCPCYLSVGRSHLGEGFTLICIQRLS